MIHLAVGSVYAQKYPVTDMNAFMQGIIAPDRAQDKAKSHYGPYSSRPDLQSFIEEHPAFDAYTEGYFVHLLTDHLFYNRFLEKWDPQIYDDYNRLNAGIIQRYGITLPAEIKDVVKYKTGPLVLLDENRIYGFIEAAGNVDVRRVLQDKDYTLEEAFRSFSEHYKDTAVSEV